MAKRAVKDLENQLKRALADYQNLEKRVVEERSSFIRSANRDLILRLLPVLDTLMLAQKHVVNEGLTLSIQQFLDAIKDEGVERIVTEGKDFDPALMECINTQEGQEGKVLFEVRTGYTLHGTVLRAAQVTVGKKDHEEKEEALAKEQLQKGDYM